MSSEYEAFWFARYRSVGDDYLFGTVPNRFLAQQEACFSGGHESPDGGRWRGAQRGVAG